jgi:hypothetical protein
MFPIEFLLLPSAIAALFLGAAIPLEEIRQRMLLTRGGKTEDAGEEGPRR